MKRLTLLASIWCAFAITLTSVSAMYTPTTALEQKVERVNVAIETIVETKMNGDYNKLILALKTFENKVAWNEMKEWILQELMNHAEMKIQAKLEIEATIEEEEENDTEDSATEDTNEMEMSDEDDNTEEMESDDEDDTKEEVSVEGNTYQGVMFNTYKTVLPAEAIISMTDSTITIENFNGTMTLDLQAEASDYMGMDTYYLLTEKEASYDVDTYTFVIPLDNNEILKAEFKQSTSAAIGWLPEFRSATLFGQWDEYSSMQWFAEEDSMYMEILEKLEIGVRT